MEGSGVIACMCGRSCCCRLTSSTLERFIASARLAFEMSHPPRTMSFGCTIGSSDEKGTCTSWWFGPWPPRRHVDACVSEPK